MSALLTDGIRAELLESKGYSVQILEFIDMEHTPKNLLIRAVRTGKQQPVDALKKMTEAIRGDLTLERLLYPQGMPEEKGSINYNEKNSEKICRTSGSIYSRRGGDCFSSEQRGHRRPF